jgi:hypothetical protein
MSKNIQRPPRRERLLRCDRYAQQAIGHCKLHNQRDDVEDPCIAEPGFVHRGQRVVCKLATGESACRAKASAAARRASVDETDYGRSRRRRGTSDDERLRCAWHRSRCNR